MRLTVYSFNATGRSWAKWLNRPIPELGLEDGQSLPNYAQPHWYEGEGRFLCLIHFEGRLRDSDQAKADQIKGQWLALPATVRDRVFWLVYSGGGFWNLMGGADNIHYVRYEVSRTEISPDICASFQNFLRSLEAPDSTTGSIWEDLYPSDNVNAATLFAILSLLEEHGGFERIIGDLSEERVQIQKAYHEFAARTARTQGQRPAALNEWLDNLQFGKYSTVRNQLRQVLGAVPD